MEILDFEMFKDGGTEKIVTTKGIFCYDHRIASDTKGMLYRGIPLDDNSNIIEDSNAIEKEIIEALKSYNASEFYKGHVERLILIKDRK